ncbi:hypothetical protein AMEX_G18137 [Astyanax mexicanus]|uniref:Uncharacterized protein n=1 Tax=Astyanax mexicanus TaxID=7994 RepID=A0A8T2L1J7_ASTMX|nr:hypothetical protein AMEX_G21852 [Astyanax mexicanus]KAG9267308.1 hypothetical protein AMEX_G18137 [Astyanax mexicanus]
MIQPEEAPAPTEHCTEEREHSPCSSHHSCPVIYPPEVKSETARKQFKHKLLREKPESLFSDLYKTGETSNLIFYTDSPESWHKALTSYYTSVKKEGICNGWKLKIKDPSDTETVMTTINIYKNGTLMVQGNLSEFEKSFGRLREAAEEERGRDNILQEEKSDCPPQHNTTTQSSAQTSSQSSDQTSDQTSAQEQKDIGQDQLTPLHTSITLLKGHFTQLEGEIVQLREMFLKQQTNMKWIQEKEDFKKELSDLREQLRILQVEKEEDRSRYRKEMAELREELRLRDSIVESLKEQLLSLKQPQSPPTTKISRQTNPNNHLQPPSITPTSSQQPPANQPSQPEQCTTMDEGRNAEQIEIALLIDSNGKFIDEKKLFPRHRVAKIWCPSTQKALELLTEANLGSPSHIIIHTGTNDLRTQQEKVSMSLKAVMEKASNTFPSSKIIISTLLPRKDFHPYTIQKINASISRDCALHPNIHLAHHPTLNTDCLHDHVHLLKRAVPEFARKLKDIALSRNVTAYQRTTGHTPKPRDRAPTRTTNLRPQHRAPHYPALPNMQRSPQENPFPAPASDHLTDTQTSILPLGPTSAPLNSQTRPGNLTYAQALSRTNPNAAELRDIGQMLNHICSRLMGHDSW